MAGYRWNTCRVFVEPLPEGEHEDCAFIWQPNPRPDDCNPEPTCGEAHGLNVLANYIPGSGAKTPLRQGPGLRELMARHGMLRDG